MAPFILRRFFIKGIKEAIKYLPYIIPVRETIFDFILGFASENGKGTFDPTWNDADLSPLKVKELKENHPKVRVVISIGGVGSEFNPIEPKEKWITNAVSSIKAIIKEYQNRIDGIDIHYDVIKSSEVDFVSYIGEVIKQLKNDPELSIKVVSIAPTENVHHHYRMLYSENRDNIDWVDYRFYNQKFSTEREFTNFYNDIEAAYTRGKVLAGISIPPDNTIFNGIKFLITNKLMPGAFVWNADESAVAPVPFSVEKELQNL